MTAGERWRRWRDRRRADSVCVTVEIKRWLIDAFIDAEELGTWDEDDRGEIGKAVQRLCESWAQTRLAENDGDLVESNETSNQ
jgi:hypothetical protein